MSSQRCYIVQGHLLIWRARAQALRIDHCRSGIPVAPGGKQHRGYGSSMESSLDALMLLSDSIEVTIRLLKSEILG